MVSCQVSVTEKCLVRPFARESHLEALRGDGASQDELARKLPVDAQAFAVKHRVRKCFQNNVLVHVHYVKCDSEGGCNFTRLSRLVVRGMAKSYRKSV